MNRKNRIADVLKKVNGSVPFIVISLLITAGIYQIRSSVPSAALGQYHGSIAQQISEFPFQMGRWVGQDVQIPTSAQKILRPNGLVSRRFSRYGTDGSLTFALIHCIDLRDMHGHHPPRCYPASGWSIKKEQLDDRVGREENLRILIGGFEADMSVYRFWRADQVVSRNDMVVVSIFITPMAGMVNDMAVLQELGAISRGASSLGVAQIQLLFDQDLPIEELRETVGEFLSNMPRDLMENLMSFPETDDAKDLRNYTFDESGRS